MSYLKLIAAWGAFFLLVAFCALGPLAWAIAVLPVIGVMTYIDHWKPR